MTDKQESKKVLLDTHIILWYLEGIKLNQQQIDTIDEARKNNSLYISAISLWEIALLTSKGRLAFSITIEELIDNILSIPGINLVDLSVSILISSCNLPHFDHKDPADRFIIASARNLHAYLISADQKILDYASLGYVNIF